MCELSYDEQLEVSGGSLMGYLTAAALGAGILKVLFSSSGRLSIPYLISFEWK